MKCCWNVLGAGKHKFKVNIKLLEVRMLLLIMQDRGNLF